MSEYVRKYASEEALRQNNDGGVSSSSESSMSDYSEDEAQVLYNIVAMYYIMIASHIFSGLGGTICEPRPVQV